MSESISRRTDESTHPVSFAPWGPLAQSALCGVVVGALAQLLREVHSGAVSTLGGGWAVWVTICFLFTRHVARSWRGSDRAAWMCIVSAAYLLAWLLAYHVLFAIHWSLPMVDAWREAKRWVLAAAPGCVAIGLAATASLRPGLLGDVCLALPIGWSVPEAVLGVQDGGSYVLAVTCVTLAVAALVLVTARDRPHNNRTVALAAVGAGLVFFAVRPLVLLLIT